MKEAISKYTFPIIMCVIGMVWLIAGIRTDQNTYFMIASVALIGIGVISLVNAMGMISKMVRMVAFFVLLGGAIGLAALNYKSIKDPVEFMKERERRYKHVIQRLKDIRTAQLAYKASNGTYTNSFDSLLHFVKHDSLKVVKAFGTVPDSLVEEFGIRLAEVEAAKMGIVKRDTVMFAVKDSIFSKHYLKSHHGKFYIDSLPYIPFTNSAKFEMETGEVERGSVKVKVFQVTDTQPFDPELVLQVGSLTDPSTSGNWE